MAKPLSRGTLGLTGGTLTFKGEGLLFQNVRILNMEAFQTEGGQVAGAGVHAHHPRAREAKEGRH